mmetsp:Transcript_30920/g.52291  ORF Transcript_30920/g.52291 Transcript_30920/m.52291 type:complete len:117 (+) Transcript_30920:53-403(+)
MQASRSFFRSVGGVQRSCNNMIVLARFSSVPPGAFLPVEEVTDRVLSVVKSMPLCPETVTPDMGFGSDLGFDSMIRKELNDKIATEFCLTIGDDAKATFATPASVISFVSASPKAR